VAPIRETLAAALVYLSRWKGDRIFADPMCGSGTIPIEAALIGRNIAPGLNREFVSEEWPLIPKKIWETLRKEAREAINDDPLIILASDSDKRVFRKARDNAENAGVLDDITFQKKPVLEFSSKKKYGCIISNPPYGERLGEKEEAQALYRELGQMFQGLEDWSCFIITSHEDFETHFGKKSNKNRKLYNGRIKTHLYQYFGPRPPRS